MLRKLRVPASSKGASRYAAQNRDGYKHVPLGEGNTQAQACAVDQNTKIAHAGLDADRFLHDQTPTATL